MGPTRCSHVALGFKGSERGSKLRPIANNGENIARGRQVWECCLGTIDIAEGNGPHEYVGKESLFIAY